MQGALSYGMNNKMRKRTRIPPLQELPCWFQPEAPVGSAVRHIASLSRKIAGVVGPGASIGEPGPARSRWRVPIPAISGPMGKPARFFEINCLEAPSEEEKAAVAQVAAELSELWSA